MLFLRKTAWWLFTVVSWYALCYMLIYLGVQLIIWIVCLRLVGHSGFAVLKSTQIALEMTKNWPLFTHVQTKSLWKEWDSELGSALPTPKTPKETDRLTYWYNITMQISYCSVGTTRNKCFVALPESIWCDPSLLSFLLSVCRKCGLFLLPSCMLGKIRNEGLKNMLHTRRISCPQEPQIALLFFQNIYITVAPRGSS